MGQNILRRVTTGTYQWGRATLDFSYRRMGEPRRTLNTSLFKRHVPSWTMFFLAMPPNRPLVFPRLAVSTHLTWTQHSVAPAPVDRGKDDFQRRCSPKKLRSSRDCCILSNDCEQMTLRQSSPFAGGSKFLVNHGTCPDRTRKNVSQLRSRPSSRTTKTLCMSSYFLYYDDLHMSMGLLQCCNADTLSLPCCFRWPSSHAAPHPRSNAHHKDQAS